VLDTAQGDETYKLTVKEAGTSILSSWISLYQTTQGVGIISDGVIAADAKVDVYLEILGTSVSLTDLTTLLTIRRTN